MRSPLLLVLGALLLSSCQTFTLTTNLAEARSGSVLFQDDFSDPTSGWGRISDGTTGVLDYINGSYGISVSGPYQMVWSSPGLSFTDVQIEVDLTSLNEPRDDNFGVVCRAKDNVNFYFLVISSDGYFGIGKVKNGVQRLIDAPAMLPSEEINQGTAKNHLSVKCIEDQLSLSVNHVTLLSVRDADFVAGDAGLIAGTFDTPGTEVLFDNFTVLKP